MRKLLTALICLCIAGVTACGRPTYTNTETESKYGTENAYEPELRTEDLMEVDNGNTEDKVVKENANDKEIDIEITEDEIVKENADDKDIDNVIMVYLTANMEYRDDIMPVQYVDDLSLLEDMKYTNSTYVYQDGKVYYRKYHEDSYEEAALWGVYRPIPETEKEIVCIDADGRETELFADKGFGDIYLINDRFYMTDGETPLYSVDMQGKNRIDYGNGKILAIDQERHMVIMEMWEQYVTCSCYYAMDYETGEKKLVLEESDDDYIYVYAYQDGWIYYEAIPKENTAVSRLCAVSLEGGEREIIALTSDTNQSSSFYKESVMHVEVDEERIYFVYGGYDGTASAFQGGKLISVKHDGTDYKAVTIYEDAYYLFHVNGRPMVYFVNRSWWEEDSRADYNALVWDIDADICYLSEFPQNILYAYDAQMAGMWRYYPVNKGALCKLDLYESALEERQISIYALSGDSGEIVQVVMNLMDSIPKREDEEPGWIQELYYADGFLYFTVEYNIYDKETSIGWRDGYRRLHSDVYRLKIGEGTAQMLYSY